jgi:hypothetical protein
MPEKYHEAVTMPRPYEEGEFFDLPSVPPERMEHPERSETH